MHRALFLALTAALLATTARAQPANDACSAATPITTLPFTATVDMSTATSDVSDPFPSCTGNAASVWFTYTASSAVTLQFDNMGSVGNPDLSAFTGGCGAPVEVGCDFDAITPLVVPVAAGQTIHVMASGAGATTLVLNVSKAPFDATPPVTRAAVRSGDPSPAGGGFGSFANPLMLSSKDVAFIGTTDGIFFDEGTGPATIALSGDATPVGGTFSNFGIQAVAPGGTVYFSAGINDGPAASGIFVRTGTGITPIVLTGDPAPDGGTFLSFASGIAVSPSGTQLAFIARTNGPAIRGLYVATGGVVTGPFFKLGDSNPCGGIVNLSFLNAPTMAINDVGEIALFVNASPDAILQYSSGNVSAVACDNGPTPGGDTFSSVGRQVRIMNIGSGSLVAYSGGIALPGPDDAAVFLGPFPVAREGDLTSTGETITALTSNVVLEVNSSAQVALAARTSIGDAILRGIATDPLDIVLAEGQPCPAPIGGIIRTLDTRWLDLTEDGTIVAEASCTGGRGIVRIPPSGTPTFVATHTMTTPAGPGFFLGDPSQEGDTTAFGGTRSGIFQTRCTSTSCEPVTSVLQPLVPVPGLPGESVLTIDVASSLAGRGKLIVARATTIGGADNREVLLAVRNGVLEVVAAEGTTVPGGTLEYVSLQVDFLSELPTDYGADQRGIAFLATAFDPSDLSTEDTLFLARNGTVTLLARGEQPSPTGDPYSNFAAPFVKGQRVYLRTETDVDGCLTVVTPGSANNLTCTADAVPTPPGGTLGTILSDVIALGSRGPVFRAQVEGGSADECLWSAASSGPSPVACSGLLLPGGGVVGEFDDALSQRLAASRRRVVSAVTDDESGNANLVAFSKGVVARIAGEAVTTPLGGTYVFNEFTPSMYGKMVVFPAEVLGGSSHSALFLAILKR